MKIAFLTEYTHLGGGETNLLNLAYELNKYNDVVIFCNGEVKATAKDKSIKTIEFITTKKWIKFFPLISFNMDLRRILNTFDIVHAYSVNVLPYLFFLKPRIVWTTHGFWEHPNGLRSMVIDKIVDKVVCVSSDVYRIANFKFSKKMIIFLGVNLNIKRKIEEVDFDGICLKLVCIGRFQRIKGQDILLDAIIKFAKSHSYLKIYLSIVGDVNGKDKEDIKYKSEIYDKAQNISNKNIEIAFEGFRANVSDYIEKSHFVIIPSRYESFSMVAIEALSCGKPIIAPNIGGLMDIVNSDNIGLLFEPGSVVSLVETLEEAVKNYKNFNKENSLKRAKFFSIENQAKQHMLLYKSMIND
ncbi:glycosyltransferase family 4 protein [Campylobacter curvus]|uniref:Glycosyltransferase, family 1 n=1 Tax=Campylobacter curvus (strain 525.92) TaxID=360105 RepID=A7GZ33_CAMC5|nr:glycosyltransferase family 4 protein [Campylobacter curvus]EAU00052.1 glycosyltransferase, family 1 [Campylobacter curvus 525.92]